MNIVKLQGGLGNQLFQYTFGLYLKEILNSELKFDFAENLKKDYRNNSLDIQKLGVELPLANEKDIAKYKLLPDFLWRVERKLTQLLPALNSSMIVHNNPQVLVDIVRNAYYDGYYQRNDYVDKTFSILKKQLKLDMDKVADLQTQNLNPNETVTGIHIRRGDYLDKANSKIFEVCGIDYYNEAVRRVEDLTGCEKFLIFTQDKAWARENLIGKKFEVFDGSSALQDFLIMSKCDHNIIANSTFSWWSAKLNENPHKVVVTPEKWYKNQDSLDCFLDEKWIKL